jgi:hypothetical protein
MSSANVTLQAYQDAERSIAHQRERTGLAVHGIITVLISACYPLVVRFRKLDDQLRREQQRTEARAAQLR